MNMKFMKLGSKPDAFHSNGENIRYVASKLVTDIVIIVGDVTFYLHKFPLLSKSAGLQKLIASVDEENGDEVHISDIPGGPLAFEICAKFCYGMAVTLNAHNVIAARSAAEYLGMYETVEKGNLIHKIDVFLNSSIFRSWKDSIILLQTTKSMLPLLEESNLVSLCIDAIATKACVDLSEVNWSYTYNPNDIRSRSVPEDWWVADLCELEIDLYKHVMMKIKTKGILSHEIIGQALKAYSYRRLPGFSNGEIHSRDVAKYRSTVDTIVWLLPVEKGSLSCSFLMKLLKAAVRVGSGETATDELVRRIGQQLEEASVNDLLIRATERADAMYDVDVVHKLVKEFLMQNRSSEFVSEEIGTYGSKLMVAKLIDAYLAEIAKDQNLPLSKFVDLAEMVSDISRTDHDRLYRAIDVYLKEHPGMSKSERKRICELINCEKLSVDACMHVVQNERLSLRVVMKVLFYEKVRATTSSSISTPRNQKGLTNAPARADELKSPKGELDALRLGNGAIAQMQTLLRSKKIFTKVWSRKGSHDQTSGSSSSHSLGSIDMEKCKQERS